MVIASAGGHWQQLMLLRPAFAGHDVHYLTTLRGLPEAFGAAPAAIVPDCSRASKLAVLRTAGVLARHLCRVRPHVVLSTGALPGLVALPLARAMGARTIWIDSVANAGEMSLSGKLARRFAHLWLCQWDHVARSSGSEFAGRLL